MRVNSETEMLELGRNFAEKLTFPAVIELVGDVGAGKTTFTRGLAQGLGILDPVTSPSFTISKRYVFQLPAGCCKKYNSQHSSFSFGELIHYDFYRLDDPGIMRDELFDTLGQPNAVIVVEWGGGVADLLPESKYRINISQLDDGERELQILHCSKDVTSLWKICGKIQEDSGKSVEDSQKTCARKVDKSQNPCVKLVDKKAETTIFNSNRHGAAEENL